MSQAATTAVLRPRSSMSRPDSGVERHLPGDPHMLGALNPEPEGSARSVMPSMSVLPNLLALRLAVRAREDFLRPAGSLTRQIKAIERRAQGPTSVTATLEIHRNALVAQTRDQAKVIEALAKQLPVWSWAEGVRGVGPLQLGQIVGEAGDLCNFANPAKLWRYFGLAVIDGRAEKLSRGVKVAFSPRLKGIAFTTAMGLRNQNRGEYRAVYDAAKAIAVARGWDLEKSRAHKTNRAESHAMRLTAKRFLRDLWREWRSRCLVIPKLMLIVTPAEVVE